MSNLYNTPRSQFRDRLTVATTEEIESFLKVATGDWADMAKAELENRS